METRPRWRIVVVCCLVVTGVVQFGECQQRGRTDGGAEKFQEEAGQIYTTVFHKYNPRVRPPNNYPDKVLVEVSLELIHVRKLDVVKQELECIVDLDIKWNDSRLAWYANKVNNISTEPSKVWLPSIYYKNGVLPPSPLYTPSVVVSSNGNMDWRRREVITTVCSTAPQNDTHVCKLTLAFSSDREKFRSTTSFTLDDDFTNHHWGVIAVDASDDLELTTDIDEFKDASRNDPTGGTEVTFRIELLNLDVDLTQVAGDDACPSQLSSSASRSLQGHAMTTLFVLSAAASLSLLVPSLMTAFFRTGDSFLG